jgi:putative ABC transport system substrate-binding protein
VKRREFIAGLGSTAVWPVPARAQQPAVPVIGFLTTNLSDTPNVRSFIAAFQRGLSETGYVAGRNVAVEYRSAELRLEHIPVESTRSPHGGRNSGIPSR